MALLLPMAIRRFFFRRKVEREIGSQEAIENGRIINIYKVI